MDTLVTMISIFGAFIVIGIIIMMHELGHYSIGRACKLKIDEFSVGFGPKIKSWFKNDIKYSIRWFFVGGYTRFHGEDEDSSDKLAFNNQPPGRRALAIAAGPVFNVLFAFILVVFMLCVLGDVVPKINKVWDDCPAQTAGIMPGDVIVEMNGVKTDFNIETYEAQNYANDMSMPLAVKRGDQILRFDVPYESMIVVTEVPEGSLSESAGLKPGDVIVKMDGVKTDTFLKAYNAQNIDDKAILPVIVERGEKRLSLNIPYKFMDEQTWQEKGMIGISYGEPATFGFFEAIALSFKYMYFMLKSTIGIILGLFAGKGTQNAAGIVGMVEYLSTALRVGLQFVLQLGVAISVSLAIINLLPLPALDGGRLVFIAIEKIFRKPVPRNVEGMIHFAGLIAFFILFILITYQDLSRIFGG